MGNLKRVNTMQNGGSQKKDFSSFTEYLTTMNLDYELIKSNARSLEEFALQHDISRSHIIRCELVKDTRANLLILASVNKIIDYTELCKALKREVNGIEKRKEKWDKCYNENYQSYLPVSEMMDVRGIVDQSITTFANGEFVYFPSSQGSNIIKMPVDAFNSIIASCWAMQFTYNKDLLKLAQGPVVEEEVKQIGETFTPRRLYKRVKETYELPIMPEMADELLKLRVDVTAESVDLANLVEKDPSLSAQLISWASSPYYAFPGKITSIEDAIIKVLGYDLVMNISLGIAIGQVMNIPEEGPLGRKNCWRNALYSAALSEQLLETIPVAIRPYRGLTYLCGLLHNFGILLLGHLFPPQFDLLNQTIGLNPTTPIEQLEEKLFGIDHHQLGEWLMVSWHMPEELIISARYYHKYDFTGEHDVYSTLTYIASQLLAEQNIGTLKKDEVGLCTAFEKIGVNEEKMRKVFDKFWSERNELNELINIFTALPE